MNVIWATVLGTAGTGGIAHGHIRRTSRTEQWRRGKGWAPMVRAPGVRVPCSTALTWEWLLTGVGIAFRPSVCTRVQCLASGHDCVI